MVYKQNNKEMEKRLHPSLPQKRWPRNPFELQRQNSYYNKVYNVLLLNSIRSEIKKILWKNQNGFQRNWSNYWSNYRRNTSKNLKVTLLFQNFSKVFDSIHRGKMEQIFLAYTLTNESSRSNDALQWLDFGDTDFFVIVAGVLKRDTLVHFYLRSA